MKRLREEAIDDPLLAPGIDILRTTPATPPMPDARSRVWAALEFESARAGIRQAMRLSPFRVLALMAALLFVGGTAGAVIGRRWIGPLVTRLVGPSEVDALVRDDDRAAPHLRPRRAARPAESPPAPAPLPAAGDEDPGVAPAPALPFSVHRRPARAPGLRIAAAPPASPAARRGDGQVLDAMVALRRDHDAARAAELLAHYLAGHPRGALREEALVLSIEAADARGDQPGVDRLVKQYRASYPAGRFRSFVDAHHAPGNH